MNLFNILFFKISLVEKKKNLKSEDCITFSIGEGTGCEFMSFYCAQNLGTNNIYFTDWICSEKNGRWIGDPMPYEEYTCCSKD